MSDYTEKMRLLDYQRTCALIEKQRDLCRQLDFIAQELTTLAGKVYDHARGFVHIPPTCATCATIEKEDAS